MSKRIMITAAAVLCFAAEAPGHSFGLRTHLYIAEQVFKDLRDCKLEFGATYVDVPEPRCGQIKENRGAFLAGAIGPDAFPDLIVGQSFLHPGTENGRQAADWLDLLLSRASTGEEIAFAFGNMIHAAGDMFAHSYVNNYAGGAFEISGFRPKDIEARHTLLEKYIDQRLSYNPPVDVLTVPTSFVVNTMVRTSYIPLNQSLSVQDLVRLFKAPHQEIAKLLGTKVKAGAPGAHMMMMWGMLSVAEHEQKVSPCNEVQAVKNMTGALRAYVMAEHAARQSNLQKRGKEPLPELKLPMAKDVGCVAPGDGSLAGYPDSGRPKITAEASLAEAEAEFRTVREAAAIRIDDLAANRRQTWWKGLRYAQRRPLLEAYLQYEERVSRREDARALRVFSDYWADDVKTALERYVSASLQTARDMVASSDPYPAANPDRQGGPLHYQRWFDCHKPVFGGDPASAALARCERAEALKTGMSLAKAARLSGIGEYNRTLIYRLLSFQKFLEEAMTDALFGVGRVLAPSMTTLVTTLTEPKRIDRDDLDRLFRRGKNGQVKFKCVSDWIDADLGLLPGWQGEGYRPDTPCKMDDEHNYARRSSDHLIPEKFVPLQHAITMGKLALLDQPGLETLAGKLARNLQSKIITSNQARYSIILDTVRSLDGSYQWNGASMPYPLQNGYSRRPSRYQRAGYPLESEPKLHIRFDHEIERRPGFPYYRTTELRREVFSKLFPEPFEGEILKAEQFDYRHYPFRPCEGDPFRPNGEERQNSVCATIGNQWIPDAVEDLTSR